jgi:predicted short-subunit dehydrogenase-like oxidoreductase (DUF2520 family)
MKVAVLGAGRVGTAMAVLLARAGHEIVAVSGRAATRERAARSLPGVPVLRDREVAGLGPDLILLGVPDDLLPDLVTTLVEAFGAQGGAGGTRVAHVSGAVPLSVLDPLRTVGARTLGLHPLQTIPDVDRAIEWIPDAAMAVAAHDGADAAFGEALAGDIGARPFRLAETDRPRYHAAAVMASNHLVVLTALAQELLEGVMPEPGEAVRVLQAATIENAANLGAGRALTGPAVRGDVGTVERNLQALADAAPAALPTYLALTRSALRLAADAGRLQEGSRIAVEEVLDRWS